MPNKDLQEKHYKCNHDVAKKHFGDTVSYSNLTTTKGRLDNLDENDENLKNLNPHEKKSLLDWINVTLDSETSKIKRRKELQNTIGTGDRASKNGGRNSHRETKNKPQDTRSMYAEGLDKEIESIKYLIEYMDNNNKNKIL